MDTEKIPQRQPIPVREKQCQQRPRQRQAIQQLPEIGTRFPDFQQTEQNRNAAEVKRQILLPELMRGQQNNLFQDLQQTKCHDNAPLPSIPMHTLAIPPDTARQHPTNQQQNGNMLSVKQGKPFSSRHLFLCRKKRHPLLIPHFLQKLPCRRNRQGSFSFFQKSCLLCTKHPVASVAQTRNNITMLIQMVIQSPDIYIYIRMILLHFLHTFRCCNNAHQTDIFNSFVL